MTRLHRAILYAAHHERAWRARFATTGPAAVRVEGVIDDLTRAGLLCPDGLTDAGREELARGTRDQLARHRHRRFAIVWRTDYVRCAHALGCGVYALARLAMLTVRV